MERKLTKTISWLLVAVLLLLSVSACSKGSGGNSKNDNLSSFNEGYSSTSEPTADKIPEHLTEVPSGYIGIYTVDDLQNSSLNTDANYILMNNLDLSSIDNWEGINNNSTFDGNNYTISNLKSTVCGLFVDAKNIQNLSVIEVEITINKRQYDDIGSLACRAYNINNCNSSGTITVSKIDHFFCNIGGMIGATSECSIKNCNCSVNINHTDPSYENNIGGILGECRYARSLSIENCKFSGTIYAENAVVGGIVGKSYDEKVKISNTSNTGNLKCDYSVESQYGDNMCIGGIVGLKARDFNEATFENCFNIGTISGNIDADFNKKSSNYKYYFGGVIGKCDSDLNIHNCYNSKIIDIKNNIAHIGGITGNEYPDGLYITNCAYLKNDSYGITSTKAMFENCKPMTENEMKDINNYPFDNINEWKNIDNSYPVYNDINATA